MKINNDIYTFLYDLKKLGGGIWSEKEKLNLIVPEVLQNEETKDFIQSNKHKILSILKLNSIFSKEDFSKRSILRVDNIEEYVLSFSQERMWFIEQYESGSNSYHIPQLFKLSSHVDINILKKSIESVIFRHDVLRSIMSVGVEGANIQITENTPLYFEEIKASEESYQSLVKESINTSFILNKDYPVRVSFYVLDTGKRFLLINFHHIASDGWSVGIFYKELWLYYNSYLKGDLNFSLPALSIQYKDYALWQRNYLFQSILEQQVSYWEKKLYGFETLNFPLDYIRPKRIDYKGNVFTFSISSSLSNRVRHLSRSRGITLNSALLGSFSILLGKYSGQDDIVTGSVIANREYAETKDLLGLFSNTQCNRVCLEKNQTYLDLISSIHSDQIQMQRYQDLPFEKLVDELEIERDTSKHPVFQIMFGMLSFRTVNEEISGIGLTPINIDDKHKISKFDLSFFVDDTSDEFLVNIEYATSLFKESTIKRLSESYIRLQEELLDSLENPYDDLDLLSSIDYDKTVYNWNDTNAHFPENVTLHELFVAQANKTPSNTALIYDGKEMSYEELNAKSNQLARHIRSEYKTRTGQELKPDTLIGLCLDRSFEMLIAILGILKSGGAYVPIDPSYPKDRIDYILEDTGMEFILSQNQIVKSNRLIIYAEKLLCIDIYLPIYDNIDGSELEKYSDPGNLAYVIYTSGTTGKPKGVMVEHRGVVNRIHWMQSNYPISESDVILQKTPYVFDVSVWELLWANWYGAKIILAKPKGHNDSEYLYELIKDQDVTITHFVPSMLESYDLYLEERKLKINNSIRHLFTSGEALKDYLVEKLHYKKTNEQFGLHNLYGPTEASIDVTFFNVKFGHKVCIGKPISNTKAFVLDKNLKPLPIGIIGELYIGGVGLSRGYLNNETLTRERFIDNPFITELDKVKGYTRLYKTGDLVRWLEDGNLEYIGRNDDQVKILGNRIELGEIEQAILSIEGVKQSCVLVQSRQTESSEVKKLVGYYILDSGVEIEESVFLESLSATLPDYMIPNGFYCMDSFPITINGKLDKRSFPKVDLSSNTLEYMAPTTDLEKELCAVWEEVLGVDKVGITDDFFRIGGDSILAMKLSNKMSQCLSREVKVYDIFLHRNIFKLMKQSHKEIQKIPKTNTLVSELTPTQKIFLFNQEILEDNGLAVIPLIFELEDNIQIDGIKYAVNNIIHRHKVLRTILKKEKSNLVQEIQSSPLIYREVDLSRGEDYRSLIRDEISRPFDLTSEYPIRVIFYFQERESLKGKVILFVNCHHMVSDEWSMDIFKKELNLYYKAYEKGDTSFSLPSLEIDYKDYISWRKDYLSGTTLDKYLDFWKDYLFGYKKFEILTDYKRPDQFDYKGDNYTFSLELDTTEKIRELAFELKVSVRSIMLGAFNVLLSKYSGLNDITLGVAVSNRQNHQTQSLIGFFTNTQPCRSKLKEDQSFIELILDIHENQINTQKYQDLPFEKLIENFEIKRDLSKNPVYQIFFDYLSFDAKLSQDINVSGINIIKDESFYNIAKLDFDLGVHDNKVDELKCGITYATSLFNMDTIKLLSNKYVELLCELIKSPNRRYSEINLFSSKEYSKIDEARDDQPDVLNGNDQILINVREALEGKVKESYITTWKDDEGDNELLVVFVVLKEEGAISAMRLRKILRDQLPSNMSSKLVVKDNLPLLSNCQVDEEGLLHGIQLIKSEKAENSKTITENKLAGIWKKLLSVDEINSDDLFFNLGGHSLLIYESNNLIKLEFGIEDIPLILYFNSTLKQFASNIDKLKEAL